MPRNLSGWEITPGKRKKTSLTVAERVVAVAVDRVIADRLRQAGKLPPVPVCRYCANAVKSELPGDRYWCAREEFGAHPVNGKRFAINCLDEREDHGPGRCGPCGVKWVQGKRGNHA